MLIGLIKWFNAEKAFGVVETPEGEEFFLHINNFKTKPEKILKGMSVTFSSEFNKAKNRNSAKNCEIVMNAEIRYNPYHRNEIQSFSLIATLLKHQFIDKNEREVLIFVLDYFDNYLDTKHFVSFCEFIEDRLSRCFSNEISGSILKTIFTHFSKNLNAEILFYVWKQKKFKYILYLERDDYEIPENIFKTYILELKKSELKRILEFSYGQDFITYFLNEKFNKIETLNSKELKELYQYVEFEYESEQEKRKRQLDDLYVQKIKVELVEKANKLEVIRSADDFKKYNHILELIPHQINETEKNKLSTAIYEIIAQRCSDEFKPELWVKGIIEEAPFEFVLKYFLDEDNYSEKQILILTKSKKDIQFELLKKYSERYTFEKSFVLIERLLKKENLINNRFNSEGFLFYNELIKEETGDELIKLFTDYVNVHSNDEQKYKLFLKGYIKNVPQNIVLKNINTLEENDCKKIFRNISQEEDLIKDILTKKVISGNIHTLSWLYDLATEFLDKDNFNLFDRFVFDTIENLNYFNLWEKGKAKILPKHHIEQLLQNDYDCYKWIIMDLITVEELSEILFSFLCDQKLILDKKIFYKQLRHIETLLQINKLYFDRIKGLRNDFYNVILWFIDKDDFLDFEILKLKFIYFTPKDQVRIIKKLFFIKAKGKFDLNVDRLSELYRFDLDVYKTISDFNQKEEIDISSEIVIKALQSFRQNKRFLIESELMEIVFNNLKNDKIKHFRLSNYFESCKGRQSPKFDWKTNGKIKKNIEKNSKGIDITYFAIEFDNNIYLEERVKDIPHSRWSQKLGHWGVPLQYETEILDFAKKHRFFLEFDGSNYTNNTHLVDFIRVDVPSGISFCEGRKAKIPHEIFKKEFWWCCGQPCFNKCETIHNPDDWENYTLLDFCEILRLNTDETNKMGDYIPKGHYYQFISLVNRFNRLLNKLYCIDCNQILYPSDFGTSHFAAHNIVKFQCRNNTCSNNDEIYLNHCLNGQCNCIIDSRVSKKCNNGLFICDNCGSCCSHNMFERRLTNLKITGGFIPNKLVKIVNEKLGHLERGEYFCYKCKSEMAELNGDVFKCLNCDIKYDTAKYNHKRLHKHLKMK